MVLIDTIFSFGYTELYRVNFIGADPVYSLNYLPSVFVNERGPFGIQADISLRGLSFNQVKFYYKGVPIYDPQTGHHNLNLPLTEMDIGLFSINSPPSISLIKRERNGGIVRIGSRGYIKGSGKYRWVSFEGFRWDGYEFEYEGKSYTNPAKYINFSFDLEGKRYNVFGGYRYNAFSAKGFYLPPTYNTNETTQVALLGADFEILKFSTRWHQDQFNWGTGRNIHNTLNSFVELRKSFYIFEFRAGGGMEYIKSSIVERRTGKGDTNRIYTFIYPSAVIGGELWAFRFGLKGLYDNFSKYAFFEPQIVGIYKTIFISAYYSRRLPDFTEMFYQDPKNFGNMYIKPEKILGLDFGLDGKFGNFRVYGMRFYDRIDWVKRGDKYYAENIPLYNILGFEAFSPLIKTKVLKPYMSISLIYPLIYTKDTLRYTPKFPVYRFSIITEILNVRLENSQIERKLGVFLDLNWNFLKFGDLTFSCGIRNALGTRLKVNAYMQSLGRWYFCSISTFSSS